MRQEDSIFKECDGTEESSQTMQIILDDDDEAASVEWIKNNPESVKYQREFYAMKQKQGVKFYSKKERDILKQEQKNGR